jgi:septal ring factor EnvC (AmiA/AmiB activator)
VKAKKPDKTVAGMAVLQDIRGLLSASKPQPSAVEAPAKSEPANRPDSNARRLEAKVKELETVIAAQQRDLDRLAAEKKGLEGKLAAIQSASPMLSPLAAGRPDVSRHVSDLEARKSELEAALSQTEGLLQIKVKDLARRIASVYSEAGDIGANRDFRRISNQLEAAENFGEFVRALTRE